MTSSRRPRFSLGTLMAFVLLLTSAAVLWWNCDPWLIGFTIQEASVIYQAGYTPDERYIYTVSKSPNTKASPKGFERFVTFREPSSGKVLRTINLGVTRCWPDFASDDAFFVVVELTEAEIKAGIYEPRRYWSVTTGERLESAPQIVKEDPLQFIVATSHNGAWKAYSHRNKDETKPKKEMQNQLILTSLKDNHETRIDLSDEYFYPPHLFFTPGDDKIIVIMLDGDIFVIDAASGKVIGKHAGVIKGKLHITRNGEFILFRSLSGSTFNILQNDNSQTVINTPIVKVAGISPDEKRVLGFIGKQTGAWDITTGKQLWLCDGGIVIPFDFEYGGGIYTPEFDCLFVPNTTDDRIRILRAKTGETLFTPRKAVAESGFMVKGKCRQLARGGRFITWAFNDEESEADSRDGVDLSNRHDDSHDDWKRVHVWRRFTPLDVTRHPEFWVMIVLAFLFGWSVWRDRKIVSTAPPPTMAP